MMQKGSKTPSPGGFAVQALASQVRVAKREAKSAASLILQQELKARRRVLRRLGCAVLLSALPAVLCLCRPSLIFSSGLPGHPIFSLVSYQSIDGTEAEPPCREVPWDRREVKIGQPTLTVGHLRSSAFQEIFASYHGRTSIKQRCLSLSAMWQSALEHLNRIVSRDGAFGDLEHMCDMV